MDQTTVQGLVILLGITGNTIEQLRQRVEAQAARIAELEAELVELTEHEDDAGR